MTDKTYTFTRGIDTVVVTVDGREAARAKFHAVLFYSVFIVSTAVLGVVIWPLLLLSAGLVAALLGKLASIDENLRGFAEQRAQRNFDTMESDRWRAIRALKS